MCGIAREVDTHCECRIILVLIQKGIQVFKDTGAEAIVSVGGGSPIDAAKAILHFMRKESGNPMAPHIAIPTTLSAAEYTVSQHVADASNG